MAMERNTLRKGMFKTTVESVQMLLLVADFFAINAYLSYSCTSCRYHVVPSLKSRTSRRRLQASTHPHPRNPIQCRVQVERDKLAAGSAAGWNNERACRLLISWIGVSRRLELLPKRVLQAARGYEIAEYFLSRFCHGQLHSIRQ